MPALDLAPLRASVLWLAGCKTNVDGRSCREYTVRDEAGADLLVARAYTWGREILVTEPDGTPVLSIERTLLFPLTGRVNVIDVTTRQRIGRLHRNGTFRTPDGRVAGRFRDGRSLDARTREFVLQAVVEAMVDASGDGDASKPDALVLEVGGEVHATLAYTRLPAELVPDAPHAVRATGRVQSIVPARLTAAWQSIRAPRGWKLVRHTRSTTDPRLELAAALFAAELSRW